MSLPTPRTAYLQPSNTIPKGKITRSAVNKSAAYQRRSIMRIIGRELINKKNPVQLRLSVSVENNRSHRLECVVLGPNGGQIALCNVLFPHSKPLMSGYTVSIKNLTKGLNKDELEDDIDITIYYALSDLKDNYPTCF